MMGANRLGALLDAAIKGTTAIDRLIARLKEERELGYYQGYNGDDMMRVVIKWAEKYKRGVE